MTRYGLIPWVVAAALLGTCLTPSFSQVPLADRVDRLARPYVDNNVIQGMVIGVIHNGEQAVRGYGTLSEEQPRTPDGNSVFEIGSMSKVFTGILLADAVVRGHAKLDQPARELLPDGVSMPNHNGGDLTLAQLATHASGLPRLPDNMPFADPENPYADYSPELMFAFLNSYKLPRAPGASTEYSNFGMGLLGFMLAQQQGMTYEALLTERITKPLGMASTAIALTPDLQSRLAMPHSVDRTPVANWDIPTLAGAGGIRSTVHDMLLFCEAQLKPPSNQIGEAIELAWKVHQPPLSDDGFAMGLGWHVAKDGSTRWHNGQTGGYHSMVLVNRQLPAAVVVLTNTATGEVDGLAEDIIRMLAGADVAPKSFEAEIAIAPDIMQRYVGQYAIVPQFVLTVSVDGDKLMVGATGQPTFRVYPRSDTEWYYKVVDATLTFKVDDHGNCTELELFQNGVRQAAKRVNP